MTGGWQSYIKQAERAMYGSQKGGFQTEEEFITAMTADRISGHKMSGA